MQRCNVKDLFKNETLKSEKKLPKKKDNKRIE